MKRKSILPWLFLLMLSGCGRMAEEPQPELVDGGGVHLDFRVLTPGMKEVSTRSVDPDGLGVQSLSLLCFDRDGLFLSRVIPEELEVDADLLAGHFRAEVPGRTQIIHFLANQNLESDFNDAANRGRHENSVLLEQLSTSSRIVYWSRVSSVEADGAGMPEDGDLAAVLQESPVMLVRNMAKITFAQGQVQVDGETFDIPFTVTGFAVCNQNSFGTVAPYDARSRTFLWTRDSFYVTLPQDLSKGTDPDEVNSSSEEYVFEHANTSTDPLSVVVKGCNEGTSEELYYRLLLLDNTTQEPLPVVRNHHYRLIIKGRLEGGVPSFAEARTAPPVNNVWLSVDQEIPSVSNGLSTLTVDRTTVVYRNVTTSRRETLSFTCTGVSAGDRPEVRWVSNGISGTTDFSAGNYTFDSSTGRGSITLTLNPVTTGEMRRGELMIKYGKLQRTIRLYSVSLFRFLPCWASTNVDARTSGEAGSREVVLMFTIPEDLPEELLPLDVLISANELNPISAQPLRVVFRGDYLDGSGNPTEEWGRDDLWDYKYVYTVTREMLSRSPRQRIYFTATMDADPADLTGRIVVEHSYFEAVEKFFTYTMTPAGRIEMEGLQYDAASDTDYLLVAPRSGEPVTVSFTLPGGLSPGNRFLLCTENLTGEGLPQTDGTLTELSDETTGTTGRVLLFTPDPSKVNSPDGTEASPVTLSVALRTLTAQFDEPVRIAGTTQGTTSAHLDYKSTVFELAARRPFGFSLQVDESADGHLEMDYADVGTEVDLRFQLQRLTGSDGVEYSPSDREFTCYIEAPMLRLPDHHASNVTEVETGLFACTIPAGTPVGEIRIPFLRRSIVSEGTIRIYTDPSQIRFEEESIVVENRLLSGAMSYRLQDGSRRPVPREAFVVFERLSDGTRVGSLTIPADGRYALRLRSEYAYTWTQTPMRIYYRVESGSEAGVYAWAGPDDDGFTLSQLFVSPDVELTWLME